jgi:hypothetical protein
MHGAMVPCYFQNPSLVIWHPTVHFLYIHWLLTTSHSWAKHLVYLTEQGEGCACRTEPLFSWAFQHALPPNRRLTHRAGWRTRMSYSIMHDRTPGEVSTIPGTWHNTSKEADLRKTTLSARLFCGLSLQTLTVRKMWGRQYSQPACSVFWYRSVIQWG